MEEFRTLTAREIDCRVGTQTDSGISLLLYKDARVDMNILDEVFGPERWQRKHDVVNGNLFCTVSIKFGDEWVSKQDVGTESKTEAEKGESSDSFKRACVNWGIGRELYTAPFIWVPVEKYKYENGKVKDRFEVTSIGYNHKEISELQIINTRTKKTVFSFGKKNNSKKETDAPANAEGSAPDKDEEPAPDKLEELQNFPEVTRVYTCERCQKAIEPTTGRNGDRIEPIQLVNYSRKKFNGTYCASCQRAMKAAQDKANGGN